ncbi:MAG TPA: hypothetical protein VGA59_01575 [Ramlibacter sp.]
MGKRTILIALSVLLYYVVVCAAAVRVRCWWLDIPPRPLVYPGSILIEERPFLAGRSYHPLVTYYYSSAAAPLEILAFYEQQGRCDIGEETIRAIRRMCSGAAKPFGEYLAYIPMDAKQNEGTPYVIEVRWSACGDDFE